MKVIKIFGTSFEKVVSFYLKSWTDCTVIVTMSSTNLQPLATWFSEHKGSSFFSLHPAIIIMRGEHVMKDLTFVTSFSFKYHQHSSSNIIFAPTPPVFLICLRKLVSCGAHKNIWFKNIWLHNFVRNFTVSTLK